MKSKKVHFLTAVIITAVIFMIANSIINLFIINIKTVLGSDSFLKPDNFDFSIKNTVFAFSNIPLAVYLVMFGFSALLGVLAYFKLRMNMKDLKETGSKGTSRFTTLKEIQQQYKSVPEKKQHYKGGGGVPVSRFKNKIFIDDSPVNNLWIGTTRSGKGEMGMFPMIDIYSRAEKQASMVLNDPKGELYASSKETLEARGYHVEVLNLDNPLQSMSYQILQLVIDYYEQGDMAKAEQYTKTISNMLYSDPSAKDKFWQDSASALCNALILGLCEKNIPHNKDKITMYTVANTLNTLASDKEIDEVTGETTTGLDKFFASLPDQHPARLQYATIKFASGAGQTVAGIFANAFDKLNIFTLTPIAKMTSRNSFDMKKVGFGKSISGIATPLSRINIQFENGYTTVRTSDKGLFTINHNEDIKPGDKVTISQDDNSSILQVEVTTIDEDGIVSYKISQQQFENSAIEIKKFEHFTKPTALFMITPDYDSSLHVIASLYVKQLYTELARTASNTKGGKTIREVIFILDEFGNMPAIEDMGSIITVCLGRNIRFNLVIQAYSQLKDKYDKAWETIDGNCANTIYILTTSNDTAEEISKKLGEKTIDSTSRSGSVISFDKNRTENTEGRRLLTAAELRQLKEGEMVVVRGIKRQDNKRKKIVPYPIFNTKETRMKYRYEYLADDFDTTKSINEIDIPCLHADIDLRKLSDINLFNSEESEAHIEDKQEGQEKVEEDVVAKIDETVNEIVADMTNQEEQENHEMLPLGPVEEEIPNVSQDSVPDVQVPTMKDLFGTDAAFHFICNTVGDHMSLSKEDVGKMAATDFIDCVHELHEDRVLNTNIYNSILDKYQSQSIIWKDENHATQTVTAE